MQTVLLMNRPWREDKTDRKIPEEKEPGKRDYLDFHLSSLELELIAAHE